MCDRVSRRVETVHKHECFTEPPGLCQMYIGSQSESMDFHFDDMCVDYRILCNIWTYRATTTLESRIVFYNGDSDAVWKHMYDDVYDGTCQGSIWCVPKMSE